MLTEALAALAAAGGTAVVQAAGKDAWKGFRHAVARWFGRGNPQAERDTLKRLEETRGALEAAELGDSDRISEQEAARWKARIEVALEDIESDQREIAARALQKLLVEYSLPSNAPEHSSRVNITATEAGAIAGRSLTLRGEYAAGRDLTIRPEES